MRALGVLRKTQLPLLALALLCACVGAVGQGHAQHTWQIQAFDADWRFFQGDAPGAEQTGFYDRAWRRLSVPHDWTIAGPFDATNPTGGAGAFLPSGVGWYRKHFVVSAADKHRRIFVRFDGVMANSDVWINGTLLGHRPYGYVSFHYELTGHIRFGVSADIDIDSSSFVLVEHCDISVNDYALCLKAGRDADGLRVNRPTTDVVIRDSTVRAEAAGITIGSETSDGFRRIDVYGLHVYRPVPSGILFKSAHTRGGVAREIKIHDLDLEGVAVPVRINMNWNPSYSYATLPPGMKNVPDYWNVLAEKVPEAQGRPRFRDVKIWNIKATGAKRAFSVKAYQDAPLVEFDFDNIHIQAQTAGTIRDAKDWKFTRTMIVTADGTHVQVLDSTTVTGLP